MFTLHNIFKTHHIKNVQLRAKPNMQLPSTFESLSIFIKLIINRLNRKVQIQKPLLCTVLGQIGDRSPYKSHMSVMWLLISSFPSVAFIQIMQIGYYCNRSHIQSTKWIPFLNQVKCGFKLDYVTDYIKTATSHIQNTMWLIMLCFNEDFDWS